MNDYTLIRESLKDERLVFVEEIIENNNSLLYMNLNYKKGDVVCRHCTCSDNVISFGNKQRKFSTNDNKHYNTFIILTKKRLKCKKCLSLFSDHSTLIESIQKISNLLRFSILSDLKKDRSFKDVAIENNV